MGWNQGFEIMEYTVIGTYNLGKLDKAMLKVLLSPYAGTDIDSGGSHGLRTTDNKGVEQVVIETMGRKMPKKPNGSWKDYEDMTEAERDASDAYFEKVGELFNKCTSKFGW